MQTRLLASLFPLSLAACFVTSSAFAAGGQYSLRPLTLPDDTWRIDLGPPDFALLNSGWISNWRGFRVNRIPGADTYVTFGAGAAYGISRDFELGALLLPLELAPDLDVGDLELYGRYRFAEGDTEAGFQLTVRIPTRTDFGLGLGIPLLFHLGSSARLDTGPELEIFFPGDPVVGLDAPLALNFSVAHNVFLGFRTGMYVPIEPSGAVSIPLGFQFGYTFANGSVDLTPWFLWPEFLVPARDDPVNVDRYELGLGLLIFVD